MQTVVLAIVNSSVCLTVTRWYCVKMTQVTIVRCSLEDSPMTSFTYYLLAHFELPKETSGTGEGVEIAIFGLLANR